MSKAIDSKTVETRTGSTYPEQFKDHVRDRSKRVLGDLFGLGNYGVNLVELQPGAWSAQRHWHSTEDEFVYVLAGELTLVTDDGEQALAAGMVVGFPAGTEDGHHLVNKSGAVASYLEIGDRRADDECNYPDIDLFLKADGQGGKFFTHKNGDAY